MIYRTERVQKSNKMPILLVVLFLTVVGIGFSVWFLQKQTVTNPHAAPSTTLSFNPASQNGTVGGTVSSSIIVNPGSNQVSLVKVQLNYDGSKLQASSSASSLVANQTAFPQTLITPTNTCNGTQCTLSATFSVGSDPTKAIQTSTTVATVNFVVLPNASGPTQVTFGTATTVYSVARTDQAAENILASTSPLTINLANICVVNQSTCSWDSITSAVTYHYAVVETGSGSTIQESDVNAPQTSVTFPSIPGKTYTCTVTAASMCGKGAPGVGTSTCPGPSVTPSITPTICVSPGVVQNLHIICPNCGTR